MPADDDAPAVARRDGEAERPGPTRRQLGERPVLAIRGGPGDGVEVGERVARRDEPVADPADVERVALAEKWPG